MIDKKYPKPFGTPLSDKTKKEMIKQGSIAKKCDVKGKSVCKRCK